MWCSRLMLVVLGAMLFIGLGTCWQSQAQLPLPVRTEGPAPDTLRADRFVRVHGDQLIAPNGSPLLIRGINLGHWLVPEGYMFGFEGTESPRTIHMVMEQLIGEVRARKFWKDFRASFITRQDIQLIKKLGFNTVRIPFNFRLFVSRKEPPEFAGPGYELLDRVIEWCKEEGLYVVLDMHAAPGGQTGSTHDDSWGYPHLYDTPENQRLTIELWRNLAERYRNEPAVLGYDLLNEPIAHYVDVERFKPALEPLYRRIVAAIREVNRHHIIILEGALWASDFSVFGPPFDEKLVYSFHKYWTEAKIEQIQEYIDFRSRHTVPIWMGESGQNTEEWITTFRKLLEANNIGWAFWTYKSIDNESSVCSVKRNEHWQHIAEYAREPVANIRKIIERRPPQEKVKKALSSILEDIKVENCQINESFLRALGLSQNLAELGREGGKPPGVLLD